MTPSAAESFHDVLHHIVRLARRRRRHGRQRIIIKEEHMEHLTMDTFKAKVFNFEAGKDWKFEGSRPAIIDFYADWCGPCRMVAPVLEELSKEYTGKLDIYKIDTEAQQELAAMFGIRSIPSILFIPVDGKPQMAVGALSKEGFKDAIRDVLAVN
jgi:thioredoxin 1